MSVDVERGVRLNEERAPLRHRGKMSLEEVAIFLLVTVEVDVHLLVAVWQIERLVNVIPFNRQLLHQSMVLCQIEIAIEDEQFGGRWLGDGRGSDRLHERQATTA